MNVPHDKIFHRSHSVDDKIIEAACKAHWPSFERMRPDHKRKWRLKMSAALFEALSILEKRNFMP